MAKPSATLTIRNVPLRIVRNLKSLAKARHHSMEQEVRDLLEEFVGDRTTVLRQIEESWEKQERRPSAGEVERWISTGRP